MMKKSVLIIVGLCLMLLAWPGQAKEDYDFKWQKIGDSYFHVCNFNRVYFIEDVENYNQAKLRNISIAVQKSMDWKLLKSSLNFKTTTVKEWDKGKLRDVYHVIGYNYLNYEGKILSIKYFLDSEKRFLFREENTETPYLEPSKDGTYFAFWDNGEIWSVVPPSIEDPNYILKKLTKETVNGKTRQEIQKQFKEGETVSWSFMPFVNYDGSYIAYISNKDSYSRGEKGFSEIWIIDTKNDQEKMVLRAAYLHIYGWMDSNNLVCSLKDNMYIYNVQTKELTPLPLNINVLYINENAIVYANKNNRSQIYIYDVINNVTKAFPKLPDNLFFLADTPVEFFTLAPDRDKFFLIAEKRNANSVNGEYTLFMLDLINNKVYSIAYQASSEKREWLSGFGPWISNNQLVVYADYSENKMQMHRTWVLSIDKGDKQ